MAQSQLWTTSPEIREIDRLTDRDRWFGAGSPGTQGETTACIEFRRFRALPAARQLFADGHPVALGGRAFDLLLVLLNARGTVVSKGDIVDRVWPNALVDEANLRFQVTALRKALGRDRDIIKTIPGRGYLLIGDIEETSTKVQVERSHSAVDRRDSQLALSSSVQHVERRPPTCPESRSSFVAILDDDKDVRESLSGLLQSAGLRVALFATVADFLSSARTDPPGCLVLDVWMPGKSGLDFHTELVNANMDFPVIFISGHADIPMTVRAMKAGAVEFLTKPVRHQELLDAVQQAIRSSSSDRASRTAS